MATDLPKPSGAQSMSRRQLLGTTVPTFVGSVVLGSCSQADRRSSEPVDTDDSPAPSVASSTSVVTTSGAEVPLTIPDATDLPQSLPAQSKWLDADFAALDDLIATTDGEAFIIVEAGEIVHEWYRTDETYARDIASAQKSVLSMLVGRAIAESYFELDTLIDELLGPDWTQHGETSTVTVRHLLTMSSGLDDKLKVVAPPGTTWIYSDAFANLFPALTVTVGRELNDIARDWLFDPAGAQTAVFYERPGRWFAPNGLRATVADLVAIGRVVIDDTHPSHTAPWLDESFAPSQEFNSAYGYLWWLNGQTSYVLPGQVRAPTPGPLIPTAPLDLVAALGKDDQKLYISRELDVVVARLGNKAAVQSRDALSSFDSELWAMILELRG
jgi:CubicO group peptidase (beta-lactamase class C family)